jgi:CRP-like cAMP-binding protein
MSDNGIFLGLVVVRIIKVFYMLTLVEKVFFLQEVNIFGSSTTEDLAHIAAITEELNIDKDNIIFQANDISDSMYIVVSGAVRLHRDNQEILIAKSKDVFGTWALFDDDLRVATATAIEDSTLLRIDREDFYDLLSDHSQITQDVLKTLSKRLKRLIENVKVGPESGSQEKA